MKDNFIIGITVLLLVVIACEPVFAIGWREQVLLLCSKAMKSLFSPYRFDQGDSVTRFFHCSRFMPLITSHKGNNSSPQDVKKIIFTLRLGNRNVAKL